MQPLIFLLHRLREATFQPLRSHVGRKRPVSAFYDPGKVFLWANVHIRWRRDRHEHRWQSLVGRNIVEDMSKFLDKIPRQFVLDVDGKLRIPSTAVELTDTN